MAVELLVNGTGLEIKDQGSHSNIDYIVGDIAAVEIKGVKKVKSVYDEHRPVVGLRKLVDLQAFAKKHNLPNAYLVFAYDDGIKYTTINKLKGDLYYGGRTPRDGSSNDMEMMFRDRHTKFKIKTYAEKV
jgi:hypothetical protein